MGAYIYSLIAGALFVGLICALSPDGEKGAMGKYIAFAGALILALIMLSPLADILLGDKDIYFPPFNEEESDKMNTSEYYARCSAMALSSIYSVDISEIKARVHYNDENDTVEKVELSVNKGGYYDSDEAGRILSDIFGFEIEVSEEGE